MKKGMTIIELMITMVILAMALSAYFAFFITNQRANAKFNALKNLYSGAESVIDDFKADILDSPGSYDILWQNTADGQVVRTVMDTIGNGIYTYTLTCSTKVGSTSSEPGSYMVFYVDGTGPYNVGVKLEFFLSSHQ